MKGILISLICMILLITATLGFSLADLASTDEMMSNERYLIIRADDFGMTHGANMALKKLIETGMPFSASVMPPTPWFLEAAEILNENPQVSVGIHLTLNSEWKNYRWGPVLGKEAVPSLVDENGYFFPSAEDLYNNNPDLEELEMELRAQIDRALQAGLNVDYVDFHMGTATRNLEFRKVTEKVAKDYGFGMSGFFGENMISPQYWAEPEAKLDSLLVMLDDLQPGYNTVIVHIGENTQEMAALVDMNQDNPLPDMYKHRYGELLAFTSDEFKQAVGEAGVTLINYRDLINREDKDE